MLIDLVLSSVALIMLALLFRPVLRKAPRWQATVTPLASIIGSGFMVVVPLLGHAMGLWAPLGIVLIVALGYAVGAVMRFNILHLEPLLEERASPAIVRLEAAARLALGFAYVISIAFYVRLLASFLLRVVAVDEPVAANLLTTLILGFIGLVGVLRGLHGLEVLEEYAVNIKLAIIVTLLTGLLWHDLGLSTDWVQGERHAGLQPGWDVLPLLAGMLLVVQGFETSRFLGAQYSRAMRAATMRNAQRIAAVIYVAFVILAMPLLGALPPHPDETAIIDLTAIVSPILPALLLLTAILSQFSAALADTLGGGGLLVEASRGRVPLRRAYVIMVGIAIAFIWLADIFQIIAIASRAFALYYLLQVLLAMYCKRTVLRLTGLSVLAVILGGIVLFAVPLA